MLVHFFQRPEKSGEGVAQTKRQAASAVKIARPELIGDRDCGRSQRAILMRSARPRQVLLAIEPQSKAHALFSRWQQSQKIVVRHFLRGFRLQRVQQQVITLQRRLVLIEDAYSVRPDHETVRKLIQQSRPSVVQHSTGSDLLLENHPR